MEKETSFSNGIVCGGSNLDFEKIRKWKKKENRAERILSQRLTKKKRARVTLENFGLGLVLFFLAGILKAGIMIMTDIRGFVIYVIVLATFLLLLWGIRRVVHPPRSHFRQHQREYQEQICRYALQERGKLSGYRNVTVTPFDCINHEALEKTGFTALYGNFADMYTRMGFYGEFARGNVTAAWMDLYSGDYTYETDTAQKAASRNGTSGMIFDFSLDMLVPCKIILSTKRLDNELKFLHSTVPTEWKRLKEKEIRYGGMLKTMNCYSTDKTAAKEFLTDYRMGFIGEIIKKYPCCFLSFYDNHLSVYINYESKPDDNGYVGLQYFKAKNKAEQQKLKTVFDKIMMGPTEEQEIEEKTRILMKSMEFLKRNGLVDADADESIMFFGEMPETDFTNDIVSQELMKIRSVLEDAEERKQSV